MAKVNKWTKYDDSVKIAVHGPIDFYRDMYEGNHAEHFPRAKELIEKGEITERTINGDKQAKNVKIPYIVANFSKVIPEITATFVSRSIGDIKTGIEPGTAEEENNVTKEASDLIDGSEADGTANSIITNRQQELIKQITTNSTLGAAEHWSNIVMLQVDGGLVGVPFKDEDGIRIDFKARDVYYPHPDGKGVDLAYYFTDTDERGREKKYLHVYSERVEKGNLETSHRVFIIGTTNKTKELTPEEAIEVLDLDAVEDLTETFVGRSTPFVQYLANEKTFMQPLGVSVLRGTEGKQDEINWTLTRHAIIFERNGKPRFAVTPELMARLQSIAQDRHGDPSKIDARDTEIVTMDENGKSLEVIQMDIDKIGAIENVKQYIKMMLAETQTSERAIDFLNESGSAAQSGIAKYYDLIVTLLKSERVQLEYAEFLKKLFEAAFWLARETDNQIILEQPQIDFKDMIPMSRAEVVTMNVEAYEKGAQSLETTVRRINPGASEEWIEAEVERIELAKQSSDTTSLSGNAATLESFLDNPNSRPPAITPAVGAGEE